MSYKKWTSEEDEILKENVNGGISYNKICELYLPERSPDSLRLRAIRYLGLSNQGFIGKSNIKHSHNKEFWATPNLLNCYWAGFCAADACIQNKNTQYLFSLMLSNKDRGHISRFIEDIDATNLVKEYKECSYLSMTCGYEWFQDLKKNFNIVPNKTKILQPPNLSEELSWAYLIGYLDGDGCISINKNTNSLGISFTSSSLDILQWVKKMTNHFEGKRIKERNVRDYTNFYRFSIEGEAAAKMFLFLYKFTVPKLNRKWDNHTTWEIINNKYSHLLQTV